MSIVLHPQASFTVVRQIANHLDTDTNYVRAVIRNAYTDVILDTLDLTDRGSQRFSVSWKVPNDPSGQGFYVSIVTSVYTDSGYTTKNPNYGDEESTYLVEDRVVSRGGGVDAYTVRRIIQDEIAKIPKPEKVELPDFPEIPEVDIDKVLASIDSLRTDLKPIQPEKVDFKPLNNALQSILTAVNEKEVPEPTDLTPILARLDEKEETDELTREEVMNFLNYLSDIIERKLPEVFHEILQSSTLNIAGSTAKVATDMKKEEPQVFDISKISS